MSNGITDVFMRDESCMRERRSVGCSQIVYIFKIYLVIVLSELFQDTAPVLSTGLNGVVSPTLMNPNLANFS